MHAPIMPEDFENHKNLIMIMANLKSNYLRLEGVWMLEQPGSAGTNLFS